MIPWYKIVVPYITAIAFVALAQYSYHSAIEHETSYDVALVKQKHKLIDESVKASERKAARRSKQVDEQSANKALLDVWNLTAEDISKPIMLFGADGGKI